MLIIIIILIIAMATFIIPRDISNDNKVSIFKDKNIDNNIVYDESSYNFDRNVEEELEDMETWIKLVGKCEEGKINYGTEENLYYDTYFYLKVFNFQIMNEKGEDTINN